MVRRTELDPVEAWRRVTDWQRHQDYIPLTTVRVTTDPETGADVFLARTGIGRLHVDDPMLVAYAEPPTATERGTARLVKTGRIILGWAVITVSPTVTCTGSGAEVRWREEARLRGTGGPVVTLLDRMWAPLVGRLLDGVLGP